MKRENKRLLKIVLGVTALIFLSCVGCGAMQDDSTPTKDTFVEVTTPTPTGELGVDPDRVYVDEPTPTYTYQHEDDSYTTEPEDDSYTYEPGGDSDNDSGNLFGGNNKGKWYR